MWAEDPIDIGVDNAERNWMNSVLIHFSGAAPGGRYQDFVLISRPDDRFVVQVSVGLADGSIVSRYYDYTAWVAPQLD